MMTTTGRLSAMDAAVIKPSSRGSIGGDQPRGRTVPSPLLYKGDGIPFHNLTLTELQQPQTRFFGTKQTNQQITNTKYFNGSSMASFTFQACKNTIELNKCYL